jgi:hypothetical protein
METQPPAVAEAVTARVVTKLLGAQRTIAA